MKKIRKNTECRIEHVYISTFISLMVFAGFSCTLHSSSQVPKQDSTTLTIASRKISSQKPKLYGSIYVKQKGYQMRSGDYVSNNNGDTWHKRPMTPDFTDGLPKGYRRSPVTAVLDPNNGKLISIVDALDVKNLDPTIHEPPVAQKTYYLRYRVSVDAGKSWLYSEPIVQSEGDFTKEHPFPGIYIGQNSIYLGDRGSIPIITQNGKILVPAQTTPLGPDGQLWNPTGAYTYTDVVILIGFWTKDGKITWEMSERVKGNPSRTTRGLIEPTLLELNDGRILMVMRGSNAKKLNLPSYKWYAVSKDSGYTWTKPKPWTFEDGSPFYSPSSMSTLFRHSSGRCFWIGNMSKENCKGNLPRWPLVMAEVDTHSLRLIQSSLLVLDTRGEEDKSKGRLDISHFSVMEDRKTKEIIVTYPRNYNKYKSRDWVTVRIVVN